MMKPKPSSYVKYFKRPLDALLAAAGIAVLSPVLSTSALIVWENLGAPVIFRQRRPGYKGRIFTMYKFRTMAGEKKSAGGGEPESARIPPAGRFLRSFSLDELPELFNILKGEMSFIGPRPLLPEYLPLYSREQMKRHDVRPGLTGLAQVSGRNAIEWGEKFHHDVYYAENACFTLDCAVLLRTPARIFRREGVYRDGGEPMEKFRGNPG